jgi:hypothetical protein
LLQSSWIAVVVLDSELAEDRQPPTRLIAEADFGWVGKMLDGSWSSGCSPVHPRVDAVEVAGILAVVAAAEVIGLSKTTPLVKCPLVLTLRDGSNDGQLRFSHSGVVATAVAMVQVLLRRWC